MEPNDQDSGAATLPARIPGPSRMLALIPLPAEAGASAKASAPERVWRSRVAIAVCVALAGGAASAATLALSSHYEAQRLAESAWQTQTLAKSLVALDARLDAVERAKPHDDVGDLRRALGDIKSTSSHDLDSALSRLSQRIDSLDREQNAKVDKLGERLDHSADTRASELTARLDKLEKKIAAAPAPSVPQTVAAKSAPQTASAKPAPPKLGPNVSMETTGSIDRQRPVLSGYVVLGARPNAAVIGDQWGERAVRVGDFLPGAGRIERIERQGPAWVVQTDAGLIPAARDAAD